MSQELTPDQVRNIEEALADGRKIEAIKLYREAAGVGLKEAKSFIDALALKLIEEDPDKYEALSRAQTGCAASALLFLAIPGAILLARWLGT